MVNLMFLFIFPFVASAIVLFLPMGLKKNIKGIALLMSLFPLAILLYGSQYWLGSEIDYIWLPPLSIHFHLRVDPLSLLFLYLTAIITPISLLAVKFDKLEHPHTFYSLVLLLQGLLIGFFTAGDLVVFTIFWEGMLLPLYFLINIWGGHNRQSAAIKFLIYMIAGSALMVAAVLSLYFIAGGSTFNLQALSKVAETVPHAHWLGAIFFLAFAVKTPLFPFHAWLPDAYCQASPAGTILLAGILSKAGIYGFFRIGVQFFPTLMQEWNPLLLGLAVAGVFYGGLAAWMQNDFKRLIAYSSFSHVNFILAGVFIWNQTAQSGALLQALNHGITITALFLAAGWLEERIGSTGMGHVSGLAKFMPTLCWITLFFVLSSVALPGLNNFVGELLILFGLFGVHPWLAAFLGLTVILSVVYMLRWMQKVYFQTATFFQESWVDIKDKEVTISLPLIALIVWIGVYPAPVLNYIKPATQKFVDERSSGKLENTP